MITMTTRPLTLGFGALLAALAAALLFASPAAAHDDKAVITVEQAHPTPTSTHFVVKMVFSGDGDPVTDGSLTATPIAPGGAEGALVTMASNGDGTYSGEVPMPEPGSWKVRFTAIDPNGSFEHTQQVAGSPTTTAAPTTTTTAAPAETTAPPTTAATETDTEETAASSDSDDDSSSAMPLVVGGVVLLAAIGGGAAYAMSRNKPATPDGTPDAPLDSDV
jgi:hypothetical protein